MADTMQTIGGYHVARHLQSGQNSQVFEVIEPRSFRHFAMKVLHQEQASKPEIRSELFHEAEVGIALRHENVIQILKIDRSPQTPHFIMEFFPSGSLRTRMMAGKDEEEKKKQKEFLRDNMCRIMKQAATGLAYMHGSGWVHCDVKVDNLLVNESGQLKIIDFAISKKIPKGIARWFHKKKVQGTRSYMSPEQIRGEILDGRADIYSLGATFYELLAGRPPFIGATQGDLLQKHLLQKPDHPRIYNKDIGDEMGDLIIKMLSKKKEDRPQSCHDILIKLRKIRIYKSQPIPAEENDML